ncbi:formate/nitrite transporter family protein [bacterium]|nr:formate/nitrite transporter family protein [bacterium]
MDDENKILGPNGEEISSGDDSQTTRTLERKQEDEDYIPVILKRTDESSRHPDDILKKAIEEGLEQYERPNLSLFLSAVSAGLIIGFAGMCVALISQLVPSEGNIIANRLAVALVYPLGFIVCIMSGTQLFTEHTATAVYPVLDKKIHYKSLFMLWFVVLIGNFVGTFSSSILLYLADSVILAGSGFVEVAHHLIQFSFFEVFASAILAGWLMAQGGWLVLATAPASSQILCIFIVTFIIGLGGLHHSIAGSAEVFSGLFHSAHPDYLGSLKFLVSAVLGNLLGGSFFVGVLNYAHIKKTQ